MENLNKLILTISILFVSLNYFGCFKTEQLKFDEESERSEISQVINSCIGWFKTKDFELLFGTVANDSKFMEIQPRAKIVKGFDQFKLNAEIFKVPHFQYVRHELKDLTINISKSGNVAWFFCMLDDINTWDGQPANWENTRWTGVLEKRNGRWIIVQQHFSFAVD